MLDELLGRAPLRERIAELEEEIDRLERQLEAEGERRAAAVRDRQESDERVNRLEDRIAELEGRLERLDADEPDLEFRRVETVSGDRTAELLDRLASVSTGPEGALSAMVDDTVPETVADALGTRARLLDRAAPCIVYTDDAGLVSAALRPVVPPAPFTSWDESFRIERDWFLPTGEFALALVRSDLFALGEYDGSERRSFVGFESDVKEQHSKGGFSQARFERLRDAQIEEHVERAREAIASRETERLFVVGQRTVLSSFRDEATVTATVDSTGSPEAALDDAVQQFWRTRLYLL